MHVIFIILLVYKIIKAEDSESKYIDLLPEKEKEEFLDKIARRILDEVQIKDDRPKESGELSDNQLNEHDAYVKRILREESLNLRKQAEEVKKDPEPDINVVPTDKKEDINNEDRYIDLTLRTDPRIKRENKRRVYTGYLPDNENDSENDKESDVDIQVKIFRKSKENGELPSQNIEEVEVTTQIDNNAEENETTKQSEDNLGKIETITKASFDNNDSPITEKNIALEHSGEYKNNNSGENGVNRENADVILENNFSRNSDVDTNDEMKTSTDTTKELLITSERISTSIKPNTNSVIAVETKTVNTIKESKESKAASTAEEVTSTTETVRVTDDKEVHSIIKDDSITNTEQSDTDKNPSSQITTKTEVLTTTPLPTKTTNSKNKNSETLKVKRNSEKNNSVNNRNHKLNGNKVENDLAYTSKKVINSVKTVHNNLPKKTENRIKMSKDSYKLATNVIKILRENLLEKIAKNKEDVHFNDLKKHYQKVMNKEYKVYEIAPDKSPFVVQKPPKVKPEPPKETIAKEQPYYVPIYNYSPNNAFYNPHNNFDSNADSNIEKDSLTAAMYNYAPDNAFYNPYNIFGPNTNSGSEKDSFTSSKNDEDDDGDDSYEIDQADDKVIHQDDNKNEENFHWDYYFFDDPHLRKFRFGASKEPKLSKVEPFKLNLPEVVKKPKFKDSFINPNDYLDMDYYHGGRQRKNLRCSKIATCYDNREKVTEIPETNELDNSETTKTPYSRDSIRAIRQMLMEKKVFSFIKPLEGWEQDEIGKNKEKKEREENDEIAENPGKKLRKHKILREKDDKTKETTQPGSKNIAVDYYYGRTRDEIKNAIEKERIHQHKHSNKANPQNDIPLKFYNIFKYKINKDTKPETLIYKREPIHKEGKPIVRQEKKEEIEKKEHNETFYDLMRKVVNMVDAKDMMEMLTKMQELDEKKAERSRKLSNDLDIYTTVLGDMIKDNNRALVQYNWLETAVDLQSAIKKMLDMIEAIRNNTDIHPSDLELLKYLVYLHTVAKEELSEGIVGDELRSMLLPRNKNKKKGIIKESGILHRVWLIRMFEHEHPIPDEDLKEFGEFLDDLQTALYDLHTAIKYISIVTQYKNQKWFVNLKQLHIDSNRKQLLEIILHMCTTRLLGMVEESAKNGVEDDFLDYVKKNEKDVRNTKEEFVFVLKLLQELNK